MTFSLGGVMRVHGILRHRDQNRFLTKVIVRRGGLAPRWTMTHPAVAWRGALRAASPTRRFPQWGRAERGRLRARLGAEPPTRARRLIRGDRIAGRLLLITTREASRCSLPPREAGAMSRRRANPRHCPS